MRAEHGGQVKFSQTVIMGAAASAKKAVVGKKVANETGWFDMRANHDNNID